MKKVLIISFFLSFMASFTTFLHAKTKSNKEDVQLILNKNTAWVEIPDTVITFMGRTFRTERLLFHYPWKENDRTHIVVDWVIKEVGRSANITSSSNNVESSLEEDTDGERRWTIPLKGVRAQGKMWTGMFCIPPVAPRGKELYIYVKTSIDLRDANKCSVTFKPKAKRRKKPFLADRWPTKEEMSDEEFRAHGVFRPVEKEK